MHFQPGDIVVRKWSKASSLKGRIYKILGEVPKLNAGYYGGSTKVRCLAPNGSQKEIYETRLRSLHDELLTAENRVKNAEGALSDRQIELHKLQRDLKESKTYFPTL